MVNSWTNLLTRARSFTDNFWYIFCYPGFKHSDWLKITSQSECLNLLWTFLNETNLWQMCSRRSVWGLPWSAFAPLERALSWGPSWGTAERRFLPAFVGSLQFHVPSRWTATVWGTAAPRPCPSSWRRSGTSRTTISSEVGSWPHGRPSWPWPCSHDGSLWADQTGRARRRESGWLSLSGSSHDLKQ